jgi:Tol biopolymer transport system component
MLVSGCAWVQRASVPDGERHGNSGAASDRPSLSDGGRFVAFDSTATNLVGGDSNGVVDVFVHDLVTDATERVSLSDTGAQATGASFDSQISDDGRYVAFVSSARLSAADTDSINDVYVRDRVAETTTLVSVGLPTFPSPVGAQEAAPASDPVISGDGSVIAFNVTIDYFGISVDVGPLVSIDGAPLKTVGGPFLFPTRSSLSDDGARVAFVWAQPQGIDAYVRGVVIDTATNNVVANPVDFFATHQSQAGASVALSGDGATVAYLLTSTMGASLYRYDVATQSAEEVATALSSPRLPSISDDGSRLTYLAVADGRYELWLVEPDSPAPPRIVGTDPLGRVAIWADDASISGDGEWVVFTSQDPALVPFDTNGVDDVFVRGLDVRDTGPN